MIKDKSTSVYKETFIVVSFLVNMSQEITACALVLFKPGLYRIIIAKRMFGNNWGSRIKN